MIFVTNDRYRFLLPNDGKDFSITIPGSFARRFPEEWEKLKNIVRDCPVSCEDWKFLSLVRYRDLTPTWRYENAQELCDSVILILDDMVREGLTDYD